MATYTWTGKAGDGNYGDTLSRSPSGAPGVNDIVPIDSAAAVINVDKAACRSEPKSAFRLSGRALLAAFSAFASVSASAEVPKMIAKAQPTEHVSFGLYFPARDPAALQSLINSQNREGAPEYHHWLTPASFAQRFGPTAETLSSVRAELAARGLTVDAHEGQMLRVSGQASAVETAFTVHLMHGRFLDGSQRMVADRRLAMTPAIAATGALIPDFSTAPAMQHASSFSGPVPRNSSSSTGPYVAADLRQAYDLPAATALTARGVHIGILIDGGFNGSDLATYYGRDDGLPTSLQPTVNTILINGGLPYSPANSSETHLDLQQSGAIALAPSILLYNMSDLAPGTTAFGLNTIVASNKADVVSMSFGGPEAGLLPANNNGISQGYTLEVYHILFAQGTSQGITFVAASGDNGAIPPVGPQGKPTLSASEPASDPYVVAVGGTNLVTQQVAGSANSGYVSENANYDTEANGKVWASGGGISIFWLKPSYQTMVPTQSAKFRTIPDVAQHMGGCPSGAVKCTPIHSGDFLEIGGQTNVSIGTSASAPDIAGLLALKIALTKSRLGWENVDIYTRAKAQIAGSGTPFHHKGIPGNNGHYATAVPYDLVIGNGTVDGRQFLGATNLAASGAPGSLSNP